MKMFEVNISPAFLKLGKVGYPDVALFRIAVGSRSLLSVCERKACLLKKCGAHTLNIT